MLVVYHVYDESNLCYYFRADTASKQRYGVGARHVAVVGANRPVFRDSSLRKLGTFTLQRYLSGLRVSHATANKIKDVLASALGSAVRFGRR